MKSKRLSDSGHTVEDTNDAPHLDPIGMYGIMHIA